MGQSVRGCSSVLPASDIPSKGESSSSSKLRLIMAPPGRFKKSRRKPIILTKEELTYLAENTHFNADTIVEWHQGFMEDCPDGRMDKDKMQIMFKSIIPEGAAGEQFLEQLFRIFDQDGDGSIDFKEFMIATDMTSAGDPEEKLRWAFRMYDKDGSGEIDLEEMVDIFSLMYSVQGYTEEEGRERAVRIFETLDKNGAGSLCENEFIKGCMLDSELLDMLNGTPSAGRDLQEQADN